MWAARALSAQQGVPASETRLAAAVRADLSRLSDLERAYFAKTQRYTMDIASLHFAASSGAAVAVSYASARTFSASASDVRLAPFVCFVIVSSPSRGSPADEPFCVDSRQGTAAAALARAAEPAETLAAQPPSPAAARAPAPTPVHADSAGVQRSNASADPAPLTPQEFEQRLLAGASTADSIVIVQFAVKVARYDPSRGVLEVALDQIPLPMATSLAPDSAAPRLAVTCFTRPAFVCGPAGLTYVARDLFRVSPSVAPAPERLQSGLRLTARFILGRRSDAPSPSLTLVALLLQHDREVLARWEGVGVR